VTDQEKIGLLAEMLEQFAVCENTYWTCAEDIAQAQANPDDYEPEQLRRKLDGEELCHGCRARELLDTLGLGGKS